MATLTQGELAGLGFVAGDRDGQADELAAVAATWCGAQAPQRRKSRNGRAGELELELD